MYFFIYVGVQKEIWDAFYSPNIKIGEGKYFLYTSYSLNVFLLKILNLVYEAYLMDLKYIMTYKAFYTFYYTFPSSTQKTLFFGFVNV